MRRLTFGPIPVALLCVMLSMDAWGQAAGAVSRAIAQTQDEQRRALLPSEWQRANEPVEPQLMLAPAPMEPEGLSRLPVANTNVLLAGDVAWLSQTRAPDGAGGSAALATQVGWAVRLAQGDLDALELELSRLQQRVVEAGYLFASFRLERPLLAAQPAVVVVDAGRVSTRGVRFTRLSGQEVNRTEGRYFSRGQVERRFAAVEPGGVFNYNDLAQNFHAANQHPDLTVSPHLRLRREVDGEEIERRVVDVDLNVEERLPLHAVLGMDNYGTDLSDNWTARLTLQHLNLTRADDVLTVNLQAAVDWGALYGAAASYYRPFSWGQGGGWTVYGGWSDVESEDVLPELDVKGYGYFAGLQGAVNLWDSPRRQLSLSVGVMHRYVKDRIVFAGEHVPLGEVDLLPFSVAVIYTDKQADLFGGFNYASVEGSANFGDFLGMSDDEEIRTQRYAADADYMILRAQAARLQRVGPSGGRQWILSLRGNAQLADGPLIPAEQIGLGGTDNVRGYDGREFLGDDGVAGTVELRTPLLAGPLSWFLVRGGDEDSMPFDRIQFVVFGDIGYISRQDALEGEVRHKTLSSLGVGVRFALRENLQLKFDWGFPLRKTEESDHDGRGYLNVQAQF